MESNNVIKIEKNQNVSLLNDASLGNKIHIEELVKKRNIFFNYYGILLALLASLFLSLAIILTKRASFFTASDIGAFRYIVQFVLMIVVAYFNKQNLLGPKDMRKMLLIRGLMGTIGMLTSFYSIKLIDPSDSAALLHLSIVIVPIISRVFLKEKFKIINLFSLIMSIFGVFLIAQPSFLFKQKFDFNFQNNCNLTITNCSHSSANQDISLKKILGISIGLVTPFITAFVVVILKKLANNKVHYSIAVIYPAYVGVPTSLLLSLVMFLTGARKNDMKLIEDVPSILYQVAFALSSGIFGVFSQIFMILSLKYEETSKILIVRSTDLLLIFLFQHLILSVYPNLFSIIGACLILFSTLLILIFQMMEKNLFNNNKENTENNIIPKWKKCLFFKF